MGASTNLFVQVSPTATEAQLKTAYKKGALKYHPGTCPISDSQRRPSFSLTPVCSV
jgi:DnaJ-class molecular chaperone